MNYWPLGLDLFGLELDANNSNVVLGVATNLICIIMLGALDEKKPEPKQEQKTGAPEDSAWDRVAVGICVLSRVHQMFVWVNFKNTAFLFSEVMFDYSEAEALRLNANVDLLTALLVIATFLVCAFTSFAQVFFAAFRRSGMFCRQTV
uniref:PhoLip_ATPase_C domain-containing protein n=1 Tax=Steinernema glaseri TaxID=37863 RepID=A0A1I7ZDC5_9BILA